jgi:ABC-type multidrug transport system fused ATPase/permease subunit
MQKFLVSVFTITIIFWIAFIRVIVYNSPKSTGLIILGLFLLWGVLTFTVSLIWYFSILFKNRSSVSRIKTILDRPDVIIDENKLYKAIFKKSLTICGIVTTLAAVRIIVNLK